MDPHVQLSILRHHASRLCTQAIDRLAKTHALHTEATGGGKGKASQRAADGALMQQVPLEGPVWNSCTDDLIALADAHGVYVLFSVFVARSEETVGKDPQSRLATGMLASVFALTHLKRAGVVGRLLAEGYFSRRQARLMDGVLEKLLSTMRGEAVTLVELFGENEGREGMMPPAVALSSKL